MWVRSQNKECLLKCNTINIATEEGADGYIIFEYIGNDNYINLGVYKSKERALEVLDEIQREIVAVRAVLDKNGDIKYEKVDNVKFYQMPEK